MRRSLLPCALLAAAAACRPTTAHPGDASPLALEEPAAAPGGDALRIARIYSASDPVVVEVPQSAAPGAVVPVAVTTYWSGCVREDTTVVRVTGLHADVVPYQRVHEPSGEGGCVRDLRISRRVAAVVFAAPGQATVRVIGRASPRDTIVAVEHALVVR